MNDTSPPVSKTLHGLKLPTQSRTSSTNDDYMFLLEYEIVNDGVNNNDISFTVTLNPKREQKDQGGSPPPTPFPPTVYKFEDSDSVNVVIVHMDYFIKGTVSIQTFATAAGQFCNNRKNFFHDLMYGPNENDSYDIQGLFELELLS